eukprot:16657-Rhodomonas_salina.1
MSSGPPALGVWSWNLKNKSHTIKSLMTQQAADENRSKQASALTDPTIQKEGKCSTRERRPGKKGELGSVDETREGEGAANVPRCCCSRRGSAIAAQGRAEDGRRSNRSGKKRAGGWTEDSREVQGAKKQGKATEQMLKQKQQSERDREVSKWEQVQCKRRKRRRER